MWGLTVIIAAVLLLVLWSAVSAARKRLTGIPLVPGIPIFGNAIALGKGGLAFITQCREQFGDVFCLRVLGQHMVWVFDPAMLTLFFKAPESSISFKPAVERFTQRIYGLPSSEFFGRHEALLTTLRQLLVPAQLQQMGQQLMTYAQPALHSWKQQGQVELWSSCQSLVFAAAGQVLFGAAFFERHGLAAVQEAFLAFEGDFELAASPIPHLLLPTFRRSRKVLLSMLSASLAAGDFEGTVVAQLLQGCGLPEHLWPNLLLAVLWASQANSMPAMFWSLALLLLPQHAHMQDKLLLELRDTAHTIRQQQQQQCGSSSLDAATSAAMLQLAMDRNSWVSKCVAEAVRLRLHSIAVRFVSEDGLVLTPTTPSSNNSKSGSSSCSRNGMQATNGNKPPPPSQHQQQQQQARPKQQCSQSVMRVPRGSILCICPIESHHDARLYPDDPWAFKPDREPVQGLGPGAVVPAIAGMGFGGGFWRCPGRFFAEMELALLLQLVLMQLDLQPLTRQQQQIKQQQSKQQRQHQQGVRKAPGGHTAPARPEQCSLLLPRALQGWWHALAVFALGSCGGSTQQEQQWLASGVVTSGCGDGCGEVQLPACDLRRLVGFKVPAEPWWVGVRSRSAAV